MMIQEIGLETPAAWKEVNLESLQGVLMVVGGVDVGKSTFARYLFAALAGLGRSVAFLDGDPGQSTLGPPTTLSLAFDLHADGPYSPEGRVQSYFVGSITPSGHMLPMVVGGARLARAAFENGAQVVVYDTSGLIDPQQGGLALKNAKIDLIRPSVVFAIQRGQELEPLLVPLRRSQRAKVVDLRPAQAVYRRDPGMRREYRQRQYRRYFSQARPVSLSWTKVAVFPLPLFRVNRLAALEDADGFMLGLGIVTEIDRQARRVGLLTPLVSLEKVNALRLGEVLLDPRTFQDERIR